MTTPQEQYAIDLKEQVDDFLDTLVNDNARTIAAGPLFEAYMAFAQSRDFWPISQTRFGRMVGRVLPKRRTGSGYVYIGVGLDTP